MSEEKTNQLAVIEGTLSIGQIIEQRKLITQVMKEVMEVKLHYGVIPGCGDKPTLLQPGAQILGNVFRLRPEYEITEKIMPGEHREFTVKCRLFLIGTTPPMPIGEGVGTASSMESKHRYRNAAAEVRDLCDVPPAYWQIKDKVKAGEWLSSGHGGKRVGVKKIDGQWRVVEYVGGGEGKVENPNPTDVHNTVLKIAKKRAFVDATITATASNDFFTQDLEDIRENLDSIEVHAEVTRTPASEGKAQPGAKAAEKEEKAATGGKAAKEEPAAEHTGDWRNVVVHFGKKTGPILGKKLGELPKDKIEWLLTEWMPRQARDANDAKLKAALNAMRTEGETGRAPESGERAGSAEEDNAKSANLNSLSENLDYGGIETKVFLAVMAGMGYTKAQKFDDITGEEAARMMTDLEKIMGACKAEQNSTK